MQILLMIFSLQSIFINMSSMIPVFEFLVRLIIFFGNDRNRNCFKCRLLCVFFCLNSSYWRYKLKFNNQFQFNSISVQFKIKRTGEQHSHITEGGGGLQHPSFVYKTSKTNTKIKRLYDIFLILFLTFTVLCNNLVFFSGINQSSRRKLDSTYRSLYLKKFRSLLK